MRPGSTTAQTAHIANPLNMSTFSPWLHPGQGTEEFLITRLGNSRNVKCRRQEPWPERGLTNLLGFRVEFKSRTPNPKPRTPNPKPRTPNPEPQTPNPKPQTLNPEASLSYQTCASLCSCPTYGAWRPQLQGFFFCILGIIASFWAPLAQVSVSDLGFGE